MRILILILFGLAFLSGCKTDSPLSFSELSKKSIDKDIQSFFQGVKEENGVHMYFDDQNESIFVYLNGSNVVQGEKALYFTSFNIEGDSDTLNLFYDSDETSDYSDSNLDHELFYKINLDKDYEFVKLFNNGKETSFVTVSGSQQ